MTPEATSEPAATTAAATAGPGPAEGSGSETGPAARKGPEQRVTRQRRAVSAALDELDDFVSTQELHRVLHDRGESVSLATTYRILQSMADDGLVDVLRNGDNEAVYRRCAVEHHHHHLLCRNCGRAVEIEAPAVEQWAVRIAAEHGFTDAAHTVEIYGLCPDCRASTVAS
ncbi:Fur family ferric uptake transcriptional regulator [Arthrobacter sp. PL16]|jgi:Fur family ferric uptake transcriptional regulator|uniref:Fur family transcriptional regulator n=1 Tax=Arthrobacter sp. PL16 TaxID=3071720 RepID=UPI002E04D3A4|nr:Fur family ferric uptake transcriptional regulator [Arthrobacter sp. PL16]